MDGEIRNRAMLDCGDGVAIELKLAAELTVARWLAHPPPAAPVSRLQQAMQLIVDEVKVLLEGENRFAPQNFVRIDKLMRICKAIKNQCISLDRRMHPADRAAARGLGGCVMPGIDHGDLEMGLGDFPQDYGPVPYVGANPAPLHQDRDVATEQSLALIESLSTRKALDAAKLRAAKLDEALSLQKLIAGESCTDEQHAILRQKISEIVTSYGDQTHANLDAPIPDPAAASDRDVVPPDDVR